MKQEQVNSKGQSQKEISKSVEPIAEKNRQLLIKAKNGDEDAYNELFEINKRLVKHYARFYARRMDIEEEDAFQYGILGLAEAIKRFNLTYQVALSTYAVPWIRKAIVDNYTGKELKIKLPLEVYRNNRRIALFIYKYKLIYNVIPSDEIIMKELKITQHYIEQYKRSYDLTPTSLDESINEEITEPKYNFVADEMNQYELSEEEIDRKILLYRMKQKLTKLEYYIIYFRYFLNREVTQQEVADTLYYKRQNLQRSEKQALEKIKRIYINSSPTEISLNEVFCEDLIPFPFARYVLLTLLKMTLSEEEYYIYYQKEVLNYDLNQIPFLSFKERTELYLRAKEKEAHFLLLDELERFHLANKQMPRKKMFDIDPIDVLKKYKDTLKHNTNEYLKIKNYS